jgi:hypothetical protein
MMMIALTLMPKMSLILFQLENQRTKIKKITAAWQKNPKYTIMTNQSFTIIKRSIKLMRIDVTAWPTQCRILHQVKFFKILH